MSARVTPESDGPADGRPMLNAAAPPLPSRAADESVAPEAPGPGAPVEIRPGLFWKRLPLLQPPSHVNVWLLSDPEGWTAIDAGADQADARTLWRDALARLGDPRIASVIATHAHYDHFELIGWLCTETGAPLTMPRVEWLIAHAYRLQPDIAAYWELMARAGAPRELAAMAIERRHSHAARVTTPPPVYTRIADGDLLEIGGRRWRAMTAGGHSTEQLALYCAEDRILIGADHVLARSAPSVPVTSFERGADPIADVFAMHERLLALDPETLVLPSHGRPYTGLHGRVHELRAFRQGRLDRVLEACRRKPMTAHEAVLETAERMPTPRFMPIALSEMMAHFEHLEKRGEIVAAPRPDGALVYRATS